MQIKNSICENISYKNNNFQIVTKISNIITDDTKEYIKTEMKEDKPNVKLWGENIQCNYIPYKPIKKPLAKLTKRPATASAFVTDFSMKYNNRTANKENVPVTTVPPSSKVCSIEFLHPFHLSTLPTLLTLLILVHNRFQVILHLLSYL